MGISFYYEYSLLFLDAVGQGNKEFNATTRFKNGSIDRGRFQEKAKENFHEGGRNCLIAAGLYLMTLLFALWQYHMGSASRSTASNNVLVDRNG